MKRVILESPYAGDVEANVRFACHCARACIVRGEAVLASHLLYPQFLDDAVTRERELGIAAGLVWRNVADYSVFYTDRGWSSGMLHALHTAVKENRPLYIRGLREKPRLPATLHEELEAFLRTCLQ